MLSHENLIRLFSWQSRVSMTHLMLAILLLMPIAGCSNDGAGGPIISSLSTPTDATADVNVDQAPTATKSNSDEDNDPIITTTSTPDGVTAHMTWDPPAGFNVAGYSIHYRKRPAEELRSQESNSEEILSEESILEESISEEPSSCSQGDSHIVSASHATITGLEPDAQYIFAINAFNETESLCSNEITVITPSTQS